MIRVLVVEDEPPIKRAIVRCIARRAEQFEVVDTAINGRQALALLETEPIDVVFTDIRMPVMDGLALSQQIRERYPEIAVVIISGYQDFAYMRQALVSQVSDYLLKPVTAAAMDPVLDKLAGKINALQEQHRRQRLEDAISRTDNALPVGEERYGAYLICAGPYPLIGDAMLPARAFWNGIDLEKEISTLLLDKETVICFAGKSAAEMVALVGTNAEERVAALGLALCARLNSGAALAVTVGCAAGLLPIAGIGGALKNIRHRLHTETKLFLPQFICADGRGCPDIDGQFAKPFERLLGDALHALDVPALEQAMQACVESFLQAGATEIQLVHFLESVLNAHSNLFDTQTANRKIELRGAVSNAIAAEPLSRDLAYVFSNLFDNAVEESREHEPAIITQIERYLRDNFDKSVTSAVLSERFGFVPSYISRLFRTHRGVAPSEYLTRYRIERAKELMEREPELLFKEIAFRVGFSDQYYFSKIFKKETGMWPTEFMKDK